LTYGKVELITNATVTLVYGRKYGLVGRNGSGKTTLLRAISQRQLEVPRGLQILHVEQEVAGDDTTVIDSVLAADVERSQLLKVILFSVQLPYASRILPIDQSLKSLDCYRTRSVTSS